MRNSGSPGVAKHVHDDPYWRHDESDLHEEDDDLDGNAYKERHNVDPRSTGVLVLGLIPYNPASAWKSKTQDGIDPFRLGD